MLSVVLAVSVVAGVPAMESRALGGLDTCTDISGATSELTEYLDHTLINSSYMYACTHGTEEIDLSFLFIANEFTSDVDFSYELYYNGSLLSTDEKGTLIYYENLGINDSNQYLNSYHIEFKADELDMPSGIIKAGEYEFKVYDESGDLVFTRASIFVNPVVVSPTSNHISPYADNVIYSVNVDVDEYFTDTTFMFNPNVAVSLESDEFLLYRTLFFNVTTGELLVDAIQSGRDILYCQRACYFDIEDRNNIIEIFLDNANNIIAYAYSSAGNDVEQSQDDLEGVYNRYIAEDSDVTATPNYDIANLSGVEINRAEAEAFVTRNYELVLGRTPDSTGLNNWVNSLVNYQNTGAHVAYGFFFSQEYINSNTSNEEFVTTLYNVFLNRQPDAAGMADWVGQLEAGATREQVFAGVANSREFFNLCVGYGITAGHYVQGVDNTRQQNINAFVARLYGICLGRIGDYDGQASWVRQLINGENSGAGVGYGFFFSPEAQARFGGVPENYVTTMYEVFLGRTPDQAGYNSWVHQLYMGASDMSIFRGFAHSQEYTNICNNYGITRGTV